MAESSEPVLFTKRAQRGTGQNAVDGVCLITRTKVRWEPSDPSKAQTAVLEIRAITRTQQAPGKPFIKLDTATGPLVLGFTTVSDRDDAVDLLKQSKPAAPHKAATASPGGGDKLLVPSAVQAAALFQEDRDLESVYKSLVVAGILSEQEFWRTRQSQLRDALARAGSGGGGQRSKQRVGLPSAMLADVKPSADGQTEKVHFTLTPQSIQQIFVERPEVHRAYLAHVPRSMDEKAFWTRYFKQQYKRMAQRRRQGLTGDGGDDDEDELFAPFRKQLREQEAAQAKLAMGRVDPTVNVAADDGERLGGGFGALRDGASDLGGPQRRTALDSIAKDVNRHAAVVLEGAPEGLADLDMAGDGSEQQQQQQQQGRDTSSIAVALAAQQKAAAAKTAAAASAAVAGDGDSVSPERLREWQERAASALDDLTLDERHKQYTPLNITDPRSYFDSTAAAMADGPDGKQPTHHHQQQQQQQFTGAAAQSAASADAASALLAALDAIQPLALPNPPCDPDLASAVVLELSQDRDEELIREFGHVAAAALQLPPQDRTHGVQSLLLEHLRAEALKTNELLRHFWACMPLLSAIRAEKAANLARHLQEQRGLLASHMRHHPGSSQQVHVTMMLRPLAHAIDAALARYEAEAEERQRQQKL